MKLIRKVDWKKAFNVVSLKELAWLTVFALLYGMFFVNFIDYWIFKYVPPGYHLWLQLLYMVPYVTLIMTRGKFSIFLIGALGYVASFTNDLGYMFLAKYVFGAYQGDFIENIMWTFGVGGITRYDFLVRLPFGVEFMETSLIMLISFPIRIAPVGAFYYLFFRYNRKSKAA